MRRRIAVLVATAAAVTGAAATFTTTAHAAGSTICIHRTLTHDINVYVCPSG